MSTRGTADVVFCIDASASMQPCIDAVRANLGSFVDGLKSDRQVTWDLRLDFLAHSASDEGLGTAFDMRSLFHYSDENVCHEALYQTSPGNKRFFTSSADEFRDGLKHIDIRGDEASLVGLDFAMDFPWRDPSLCHRVVIMLTDEPMEQGLYLAEQERALFQLIEKIHALKLMLFLVAPESAAFEKLSGADKCEWEVVSSLGDGLASVDFRKVLGYIGKSVSESPLQQTTVTPVKRGLFEQSGWVCSNGKFKGV